MGLKPLKTLFCWFSRKYFWFSLVFFGIFGFPEGFFGFLKTFGKTKKTNKTKPISKGGSETFKNFVLLVFPKVFLVFFGFLWYFWFSRRFFWFSKNLRENQKNKQDQTHIQTQGAQGPSERGVKTAFWSQQYKIKLFVV